MLKKKDTQKTQEGQDVQLTYVDHPNPEMFTRLEFVRAPTMSVAPTKTKNVTTHIPKIINYHLLCNSTAATTAFNIYTQKSITKIYDATSISLSVQKFVRRNPAP